MFLSFTSAFNKCWNWFVRYCKNFGLLSILVVVFFYLTTFLILLIRNVVANRKELKDLIINRKDSAMIFQYACVEDYESKEKMEENRVKNDFDLKDEEEVNNGLKLDLKQKESNLEHNRVIGIDLNDEN